MDEKDASDGLDNAQKEGVSFPSSEQEKSFAFEFKAPEMPDSNKPEQVAQFVRERAGQALEILKRSQGSEATPEDKLKLVQATAEIVVLADSFPPGTLMLGKEPGHWKQMFTAKLARYLGITPPVEEAQSGEIKDLKTESKEQVIEALTAALTEKIQPEQMISAEQRQAVESVVQLALDWAARGYLIEARTLLTGSHAQYMKSVISGELSWDVTSWSADIEQKNPGLWREVVEKFEGQQSISINSSTLPVFGLASKGFLALINENIQQSYNPDWVKFNETVIRIFSPIFDRMQELKAGAGAVEIAKLEQLAKKWGVESLAKAAEGEGTVSEVELWLNPDQASRLQEQLAELKQENQKLRGDKRQLEEQILAARQKVLEIVEIDKQIDVQKEGELKSLNEELITLQAEVDRLRAGAEVTVKGDKGAELPETVVGDTLLKLEAVHAYQSTEQMAAVADKVADILGTFEDIAPIFSDLRKITWGIALSGLDQNNFLGLIEPDKLRQPAGEVLAKIIRQENLTEIDKKQIPRLVTALKKVMAAFNSQLKDPQIIPALEGILKSKPEACGEFIRLMLG